MKIKRYMAASMRAALDQVRLEQGPDAVILSSRRIDEGVEVIAAVDYDEALIAGAARQYALAANAAAASAPGAEPKAPAATDAGPAANGAAPVVRAAHDPRAVAAMPATTFSGRYRPAAHLAGATGAAARGGAAGTVRAGARSGRRRGFRRMRSVGSPRCNGS